MSCSAISGGNLEHSALYIQDAKPNAFKLMCVECFQEYLARLRQIRLQNFNERRNIQENLKGKGDAKYKVCFMCEIVTEINVGRTSCCHAKHF